MNFKNIFKNKVSVKSKKRGNNLFLYFDGSGYVISIDMIRSVQPAEINGEWCVEINYGSVCKSPNITISTKSEAQARSVSLSIYKSIGTSIFSWLKWPVGIVMALTVMAFIPYTPSQSAHEQQAQLPQINQQAPQPITHEESFNPLTGGTDSPSSK